MFSDEIDPGDAPEPPSIHAPPAGLRIAVYGDPHALPGLRPGALDRLEQKLTAAAQALGGLAGELSLAVVDDPAMADLHQRYKGEPGPTDVLTFDLRDDPAAPVDPGAIEGEVVVCWPEAERQTAADPAHAGRDPEHELLLYALHGLLHLLGQDDLTPEGFARMHQIEDRVLAQIGVGAVFNPSAVADQIGGAQA
ncbi:MAG: rRNA maturation RNase YbeY [Planctomycetota bacterium]